MLEPQKGEVREGEGVLMSLGQCLVREFEHAAGALFRNTGFWESQPC